MATDSDKTSVRIVRRWQDRDCATGDSKVKDEKGRIWHTQRSLDPFPVTGEVRGTDTGNWIKNIR